MNTDLLVSEDPFGFIPASLSGGVQCYRSYYLPLEQYKMNENDGD